MGALSMQDLTATEKYRSRLAAEVAKQRLQLQATIAKLEATDEIIALQQAPETKPGTATPTKHPEGIATLVDYGPTEACLAVVEAFGKTEWLTNRRIRDLLVKNEFRSKGENFAPGIAKTLRRLHESGRLKAKISNGDWTYKANSDEEPVEIEAI